jgi:uncharacterized membrane protein
MIPHNESGNTQSRMARVVERNINALLKRQKEEDSRKSRQQTMADLITRFTGSMPFVYLHLFLFGIWISWNAGWIGLKPFDPSFVMLAMFASVEAIFLSTFVLISQNRLSAQTNKRAELDLQVSLLAEHEITRLITMVTAIAKKLNLEEANDLEIDELAKDVYPEKVMDTIDKISGEHENG